MRATRYHACIDCHPGCDGPQAFIERQATPKSRQDLTGLRGLCMPSKEAVACCTTTLHLQAHDVRSASGRSDHAHAHTVDGLSGNSNISRSFAFDVTGNILSS